MAHTKALNPGKPKHINAILIVALVLCLSGALGLLYVNYANLVVAIKEQVPLSVYLPLTTTTEDAQTIADDLQRESFTRDAKLITQDEAKQKFLDLFEDDFSDILEYNPLPASVDIYPKAEYLFPEKLAEIERVIHTQYNIPNSGIVNNKDLIGKIDRNLSSVSIILSAVLAVMCVLSIIIINSTVRLSLYSDRFLLKSQQLVGAHHFFILKPYLKRAFWNGLMSAILASAVLYGLLALVQEIAPMVRLLFNWFEIGIIFGAIALVGIFYSVFSTYASVSRFLRMKLDDLY